MKRPVRNVSSVVKTFSCLFSYPKPRNLKNDECLSRSSIDSVTACKPERRFSKDCEDLQLHRCSSKGFSFTRNVSNVSKRESSWYEPSFIPDSKVFRFHRLNKSYFIDGRWLGKICLRFLLLRVLAARVRIICRAIVCDVTLDSIFFRYREKFLILWLLMLQSRQTCVDNIFDRVSDRVCVLCTQETNWKDSIHLYLFHLRHIATRLTFYLSILCTCHVYRQ